VYSPSFVITLRIVLTPPLVARRSILIVARQECIFAATHLRMTFAGRELRRNVSGDIFNGLLLTNCTVAPPRLAALLPDAEKKIRCAPYTFSSIFFFTFLIELSNAYRVKPV